MLDDRVRNIRSKLVDMTAHFCEAARPVVRKAVEKAVDLMAHFYESTKPVRETGVQKVKEFAERVQQRRSVPSSKEAIRALSEYRYHQAFSIFAKRTEGLLNPAGSSENNILQLIENIKQNSGGGFVLKSSPVPRSSGPALNKG